jgi:phosphatidylglycerophosphatase A
VNASAGPPSSDWAGSSTHDAATRAFRAVTRRPRFALVIATACGLGYIPKAPGTFGSIAGIFLVSLPLWIVFPLTLFTDLRLNWGLGADPIIMGHVCFGLAAAFVGVWAASRAARFWNMKDPQQVVIDEVSGQHLAIILGTAFPIWWRHASTATTGYPIALLNLHTALSWKYLLLGFILFRVFDIWKPFPVRQAESLPGGWGIMADDWVAGVYAAVGLWLVRAAGL